MLVPTWVCARVRGSFFNHEFGDKYYSTLLKPCTLPSLVWIMCLHIYIYFSRIFSRLFDYAKGAEVYSQWEYNILSTHVRGDFNHSKLYLCVFSLTTSLRDALSSLKRERIWIYGIVGLVKKWSKMVKLMDNKDANQLITA